MSRRRPLQGFGFMFNETVLLLPRQHLLEVLPGLLR
jgi:hypothetical protein